MMLTESMLLIQIPTNEYDEERVHFEGGWLLRQEAMRHICMPKKLNEFLTGNSRTIVNWTLGVDWGDQ